MPLAVVSIILSVVFVIVVIVLSTSEIIFSNKFSPESAIKPTELDISDIIPGRISPCHFVLKSESLSRFPVWVFTMFNKVLLCGLTFL